MTKKMEPLIADGMWTYLSDKPVEVPKIYTILSFRNHRKLCSFLFRLRAPTLAMRVMYFLIFTTSGFAQEDTKYQLVDGSPAPIFVKIHDKIIVGLELNGGTPYFWTLKQNNNEIVSVVSIGNVRGRNNGEFPNVGLPEVDLFTIEGNKNGCTKIEFILKTSFGLIKKEIYKSVCVEN